MSDFQALASVEELADYVGEPIVDDVDRKRADMMLRLASVLVSDETGTDFGGQVPEKVNLITLSCASRGFLNPEGWANERIDDWGAGGRPVEELGLYLTGTEKRSLALFRPRRSQIGSVSTFRGDFPGGSSTRYVPTAPPGEPQTPIPWW